jgi:hypothetical protein
MIEANATDLGDRFADQSFDIVFSNSVTKPVGDESQQRAVARKDMHRWTEMVRGTRGLTRSQHRSAR